jgi:hypothetical protein
MTFFAPKNRVGRRWLPFFGPQNPAPVPFVDFLLPKNQPDDVRSLFWLQQIGQKAFSRFICSILCKNPSWRQKLPFADEPHAELAAIQTELTTDGR